jgi:hypothetical protein
VPNPNVPQGNLNKVRGTVSVIDHPELNVSAPFLGDDGISLNFDNDASAYLGTMTGAVQSPNPYQMATVTARALKTQGLADTYKSQFETDTNIGDVVVTPDADTLSPYYLRNCVLQRVNDLTFSGKSPDFPIVIKGTYETNSSMFDA